MVQTQFGRGIQRFRSDNAWDFFNTDLNSFFTERGILHESSCVATPEQNGMAEHRIGYVNSTARTLLLNYQVPRSYWGEAILTSTHLVNRLPSQRLQFSSPLNRMNATFPDVCLRTGLLPRVFGCTAYVHDTSPALTKLDARSFWCVFVGYSSLQKGYRCYHPSSRQFFILANVTFAEHEPFFGTSSSSSCLLFDAAPLASPLESLSSLEPTVPVPSSFPPAPSSLHILCPPEPSLAESSAPPFSLDFLSPPITSSLCASAPPEPPSPGGPALPSSDALLPSPIVSSLTPLSQLSPSAEDDDHLGWPIALWKGVRQCTPTPLYLLSHYLSFTQLSTPYRLFLSHIESNPIPRRLTDAIASPHWKAAMDEEMQSLLENYTWDIVPLPQGKKAVGCKWVHVKKHHADGTLER